MPVRIVTDSTSDLPADVIAAYGIAVVPLTIRFGQESLLDGVDIDGDTFYSRLRSEKDLPQTSQPSAEQFRATYERVAAGGPAEIVSIHISSKMSGTLNSARLACEELPPGVRVELVDSASVSLGLGAIVLEAAEAAANGAGIDEVVAAARAATGRVGVVAMLDTLEYLRRGGRIGRAQSLLGGILNVKPILHVEAGEMAPLERVRTRTKAVERLIELATADHSLKRIFVAGGGDDAAARDLLERVRQRLPGVDVRLGRIGPAVGVHAGPGVLGFCPVARA